MTLQDLNRFLALRKQLDSARESLLDLQDAAVPGAQVLTGMPHAPGVKDKVGNLAIMIADTKTEIERMEQELAEMEADVDAFIRTIPNVELRNIFRFRFLLRLTWEDIAEMCRWRYTETALRKRVITYLERFGNGR